MKKLKIKKLLLMYYHQLIVNDNPSTINFGKLDDINHNFICNNPISIENNKHPDDPKLNEYINILKKSMKDYIDKNC